MPISKPISELKRLARLALRLSDLVLTVTSKSLKYDKLKSLTVPDSLVRIVPAGKRCKRITLLASVSPSIASSNDSAVGAKIPTGIPRDKIKLTALEDLPD